MGPPCICSKEVAKTAAEEETFTARSECATGGRTQGQLAPPAAGATANFLGNPSSRWGGGSGGNGVKGSAREVAFESHLIQRFDNESSALNL